MWLPASVVQYTGWETCGYNYCYLISVVILDYEGSLFNDFTIGLKARARTAQLK